MYGQDLQKLLTIEAGINSQRGKGILSRGMMKPVSYMGFSYRMLVASLIVAIFMIGESLLLLSKQSEIDSAVDSLQRKYSQVRDLRMDFIQNYRTPRRISRTETGILYLRRPGMMRWEYKTPGEKLFVSNGKSIYFYLPEEHQVQKTSVKESRDQRVPFLFLLGKGNLKKDFSRIEWAVDQKPFFEGNKVLYAYPKRSVEEFARILMEFDPNQLELQRIVIFDIDGSESEFVFTNIRKNLGLSARIFDFKIPPNVEVLGAQRDLSQ